jgi:ketosteroid isomerase-like protein
MQTNDNAGDRVVATVATALDGVIVRGERNMLADTAAPGLTGARAALETFYYAFNSRSPDLYQRIWADDPLVQLDTPLAGSVRGSAAIAALAARMFSGSMRIQTTLDDIVAYVTPELAVFTERERGSHTSGSEREAQPEVSEGRTICVFRFIAAQGGWRLVYHRV